MMEANCTALIVLDEEGDSRGWIGERHLAAASGAPRRRRERQKGFRLRRNLTAADIMDEDVPECPADIPLAQPCRSWPTRASIISSFCTGQPDKPGRRRCWQLRDVVRALGRPRVHPGPGRRAPRPTPMDLFRQRYGYKEGLAVQLRNDGLIMDRTSSLLNVTGAWSGVMTDHSSRFKE